VDLLPDPQFKSGLLVTDRKGRNKRFGMTKRRTAVSPMNCLLVIYAMFVAYAYANAKPFGFLWFSDLGALGFLFGFALFMNRHRSRTKNEVEMAA
jgi:hypothetical protein